MTETDAAVAAVGQGARGVGAVPTRGGAGAPAGGDVRALVRQLVDADQPWDAAQWESVPRAQLIAVQRELGALRRRVDAVMAGAAAEVDRRSQREDGAASLSRREGFASPAKLVADATGGSTGEANRLIRVGSTMLDATRPEPAAGDGMDNANGRGEGRGARSDDAGAAPAPKFRVLASAVREARISVDAANAISAMLHRVARTVVHDEVMAAERHLVERALTLPLDKLAAVIRQCEAHLDHQGEQDRENVRHASRYLHVYENRDGMVTIDGRLDAVTAAPLRAALDGMVGEAMRKRREQATPVADDRTAPQMRADALADLARHGLGCEGEDRVAPTTTVVVRMGLEDLKSGVGTGEIDGFDQPVSVGALRRMAADAEVIPAVLGGDSEVLDWGRARRLFTRAQRLALVERDGGCAWCHAPPSFCEAHHILWWDRDNGPTDLDNGLMLCTACHHRLHRDHWEISVRDGTVWFTPPAEVDRSRTPVVGGRARYEYAQAA